MKTIKDVKARMVPGARLLCVENTLQPLMDGTVRTIVKRGATRYQFTLDQPAPYGQPDSVWGGDIPPGIKVIDGATFSMPIGPRALKGQPDGTVTLRFQP